MSDGEKFTAIEMDGRVVAGFSREDDTLLLNLEIKDAVLNSILKIEDGELVVSTEVKDVTMEGPNLVVKPNFSIKPFALKFFEQGVSIFSRLFYGWGKTIEVNQKSIVLSPGKSTMSGCSIINCRTGLSF